MRGRELLRLLTREPLGYRVVRQRGSHRTLVAPGRRPIVFAFHDRAEVRPRIVEEYLVERAGLTAAEARRLLGGRPCAP